MINLVVADDQTMIRGALCALLEMEENFAVVGQAGDGKELLELLQGLTESGTAVDVVVMDIEMPRLDGLTACAAVRRRFPKTRVLIVTTFGRPGYVRRALEAGAGGFIVKDSPLEVLAASIEGVNAGRQVIDPELAVETLTRGDSPLTLRETEVLQAFLAGGTVADVASSLGLTAGTIRNYVSAAMDKTGARTRAEAARFAVESGWLDPGT